MVSAPYGPAPSRRPGCPPPEPTHHPLCWLLSLHIHQDVHRSLGLESGLQSLGWIWTADLPNEGLGESSHAPSHACLLSCYSSPLQKLSPRLHGPQSLKYLLSDPLKERLPISSTESSLLISGATAIVDMHISPWKEALLSLDSVGLVSSSLSKIKNLSLISQ